MSIMIKPKEVYIYSDQPTTCPICGVRSEAILDLLHTEDAVQVHQCLSEKCKFEFVLQQDPDFDTRSFT